MPSNSSDSDRYQPDERAIENRDAHFEGKLLEADAFLNAAGSGHTPADRAFDLLVAGSLDLLPGIGAVLQRISDDARDRRLEHVSDAVRAIVSALASVQGAVISR